MGHRQGSAFAGFVFAELTVTYLNDDLCLSLDCREEILGRKNRVPESGTKHEAAHNQPRFM